MKSPKYFLLFEYIIYISYLYIHQEMYIPANQLISNAQLDSTTFVPRGSLILFLKDYFRLIFFPFISK